MWEHKPHFLYQGNCSDESFFMTNGNGDVVGDFDDGEDDVQPCKSMIAFLIGLYILIQFHR